MYVHRGIAYNGKAEYDRAIPDFTSAVRLNPNSFEAFYHRGMPW
jgi:hypothetical protein